jgi:hypothetical protein
VRLVRPVLVLAAVAAVGLAAAASAAPAGPATVTFADPAGDNVSPSGGQDITGVTWTTAGTGTGKKYVVKSLVLTLTLAAPPTTDGTTLYGVDANLTGCGDFYVNYMPGANLGDTFNWADCGGDGSDPTGGSGTSFEAVPEVKGNSIVWTLPIKSLPGEVKAGTSFSGLNALTDFVDPATGIIGSYGAGGPALEDTAATDKSFVVG